MRLGQALTRAASVSSPGAVLAYVRPEDGGASGGSVLARGVCFSSRFDVTEDDPLPASFSVGAKVVAAALRTSRGKVLGLEVDAWPHRLLVPSGIVDVAGPAPADFFCLPDLSTASSWEPSRDAAALVLAVAGKADVKDTLRPALGHVHFKEDYVEAGDEAQLCRATVRPAPWPSPFSVSAVGLHKLRLSGPSRRFWFGPDFLVIEVGGELRVVWTVPPGGYPDLDGEFGWIAVSDGSARVVTRDLLAAVRIFKYKPDRRFLRVQSFVDGLVLSSLLVSDLVANAPAEVVGTVRLDVVVQGDRLVSVVKSWVHPEVNVTWPGGTRPVLFWSDCGSFAECLYPVVKGGCVVFE